MGSEQSRVELKLGNDRRLVSAVGGAVEHVAQRVGFDAAQCRELVAAAEQACRDAFRLLSSNNAMLGVTVEDFPDRVEITLVHLVERGPAAGGSVAEAGPATPPPIGFARLLGVDRVEHDIAGGASRTTLVKYLRRPF